MFSQVFNKAKGIFSKRDIPSGDSEDSSVTAHASQSASTDSTDKSISTITEMVVTRSRGDLQSSPTSGPDSAANGKRKTNESNADGQSSKRRRISEQHENGLMEELTPSQPIPEDKVVVEITEIKEKIGNGLGSTEGSQAAAPNPTPKEPNNHIRFGSEEPELPIRTLKAIENHEPAARGEVPDSDDEDDEAPEVVDNSAQLLSLKVQAQKQKEAKRRDEILQKEKRRLQDEKHKSQAKASSKPKAETFRKPQSIESKPIPNDDLVSESTATLQGSVVRDPGRRVLPALLPDEILNAEPDYRLPSPPPEEKQPRKDTRRHKFFKDVEKPAKDLHRGDVTIRVLEDKKTGLPPKSSKAGMNVRAAWMAGQRSRHGPAGLKRVGGGPKSFVRR